MSAPEPPEHQPEPGGPPQRDAPNDQIPAAEPPSASLSSIEHALANSEPTQVVRPAEQPVHNDPEPTESVLPGAPPPGDVGAATQYVRPGAPPPGDAGEATQFVRPGAPPPGDIGAATQYVRPGAPPPGDAGEATQFVRPGAPPQYGPLPPAGYGAQPGFGSSPQRPGYGAASAAPSSPSLNQLIPWVVQGVVAVLALVVTILMIRTCVRLAEYSPSSVVADACAQFSGQEQQLCLNSANSSQQMADAQSASTLALVLAIVMLVASLGAITGSVLAFLKLKFAPIVIVAAGALLLLFSIILGAKYMFTGELIYVLIAGLVIGAIGGLGFLPRTRGFVIAGDGDAGSGGNGGGRGGQPNQPGGPFGAPPQPNPYGPYSPYGPPPQPAASPYGMGGVPAPPPYPGQPVPGPYGPGGYPPPPQPAPYPGQSAPGPYGPGGYPPPQYGQYPPPPPGQYPGQSPGPW